MWILLTAFKKTKESFGGLGTIIFSLIGDLGISYVLAGFNIVNTVTYATTIAVFIFLLIFVIKIIQHELQYIEATNSSTKRIEEKLELIERLLKKKEKI